MHPLCRVLGHKWPTTPPIVIPDGEQHVTVEIACARGDASRVAAEIHRQVGTEGGSTDASTT